MSMKYKKDIQSLLAVTISSFIYSLNMKIFVENGNLFPGGFSGLSRMITNALDMYLHIYIQFELNVCLPILSSHVETQCDDIRKWGLWEAIRA